MLSYISLSFSRCSIDSGKGLGLRFTVLSYTRPGLLPTVFSAIKMNNVSPFIAQSDWSDRVNSQIIFRVSDFRKYLLHTLGKPTIDSTTPYDSAFKGKKGIIAFTVNWSDATGHIALWNVTTYREPAHDDYSTFVSPTDSRIRTTRAEFWELS